MQLHIDNSHKKIDIKYITFSGLMLAVALVLSYIESIIPFNASIPGFKLGLANLCVVIFLYLSNPILAITINLLRIVLAGFMFGNLASIMYSLAGALLSFAFMLLFKKTNKFSIGGVSLIGGVTHNLGQCIVASLVVSNFSYFYYLPVLLIVGAITGIVIGYVAKLLMPHLSRLWR